MYTALLAAVDAGDGPTVRKGLINLAANKVCHQSLLDQLFVLAIAHRESEEMVEDILKAGVSQNLVDETHECFATAGTAPRVLRLIQGYISQDQDLRSRRLHARSKTLRTYYIPDMFEDEQLRLLKKVIASRFSPQTRRAANLSNRLMDQAFVNDLFLVEVRNGHRITIQHLFYPASRNVPRPDQSSIAAAFQYCVLRHYFTMAEFLVRADEGPIERDGGFRLSQDELDHTFRLCADAVDNEALSWLLGQKSFNISPELISDLYVFYYSSSYRRQVATQLIPQDRRKFISLRGREWQRATAMTEAVLWVLENSVTSETRERRQRQEQRRRQAQEVFGNLQRDRIMEIHSFSGTHVHDQDLRQDGTAAAESKAETLDDAEEDEDGEGDTAHQRITGRSTLNTAVRKYLRHHAPSPTLAVPEALAIVSEHLNILFPSHLDRESAERILSTGLTDESLSTMALVVTYLHSRSPQSIPLWLQGFLVESVQMNSCNPGIVERIVTGLRGVGDPGLDYLFQQVEGPSLARFFLAHAFNIAFSAPTDRDYETKLQRARELAVLCVENGITEVSDVEEVGEVVQRFALAKVREYVGDGASQLESTVASVAQVVMDCYEDFVLPHLHSLLGVSTPVSAVV